VTIAKKNEEELVLTQKRYQSLADPDLATSSALWDVKLVFGDDDAVALLESDHMVIKRPKNLIIRPSFFRCCYLEDELFAAVLANVASMKTVNVLALLDDTFCLCQSGQYGLDRIYRLLQGIRSSKRMLNPPVIAEQVMEKVGILSSLFKLSKYRTSLAQELLEEIGDSTDYKVVKLKKSCTLICLKMFNKYDDVAEWKRAYFEEHDENTTTFILSKFCQTDANHPEMIRMIEMEASDNRPLKQLMSRILMKYLKVPELFEAFLFKNGDMLGTLFASSSQYKLLRTFLQEHWEWVNEKVGATANTLGRLVTGAFNEYADLKEFYDSLEDPDAKAKMRLKTEHVLDQLLISKKWKEREQVINFLF
jgi:hypothetical protein